MASEQGPPDVWASGNGYENYVGRWSRRVAREFVRRLGVREGARWLDVGCGTGALTTAVLELAAPAEVVGVEPSPAFLALARAAVRDPRVSFQEGDAVHLPEGAAFDAVVSGLVLNFVPDRSAAVAAMSRVAPGGVLAAYVWDYAGGMQMMRHFWDAALACDPAAAARVEGNRFPSTRPDALHRLFTCAGLGEVTVEDIVVPTRFADFDDYWSPFLGGTGPAPAYAATLSPPALERLRGTVRAGLPTAADGSIELTARAWSVRGSVPGRSG